MSSHSDPSPVKSLSSNGHTSRTTSVPEVSSLSNSSSNRTQIIELRQRVELLKIQLLQREKELEKEKWEKEGEVINKQKVQSNIEHLQVKSTALSAVCEDLLEWIKTSEVEETKRIKDMETLFRKNLHSLTETANSLRMENGRLKQRESDNEAKMNSIAHENNYLRWETEEMKKEIGNLKANLTRNHKEYQNVRRELAETQQQQRKVTRSNTAKKEIELQTAVQSTTTRLEQIRRLHDDREKEYGLTLTRMQNEMDFILTELDRKEKQTRRLTAQLDELTIDNKKLLDINGKLREHSENEVDNLTAEVSKLRLDTSRLNQDKQNLLIEMKQIQKGLAVDDPVKRTDAIVNMKEEQLKEAQETIRILKEQILQLLAVNELSSSMELKHDLKRKCLRMVELENKVRLLEKECANEREQRENSTVIMLEMGKDMKVMIDTLKKNGL